VSFFWPGVREVDMETFDVAIRDEIGYELSGVSSD